MAKEKMEHFVQLPSWIHRDSIGRPIIKDGLNGSKFIEQVVQIAGPELEGIENEGIIESINAERVVAGIIRTTEEMQNAERIKKEQQKGEKRFNKLLLIPIVASIIAAGMLAYHNLKTPVPDPPEPPGVVKNIQEQVDVNVNISRKYYAIPNPALDLSANAGMLGQEQMTNQFIWKEILAYSQDSHADIERNAVNGFEWFENIKAQIDSCFAVLGDSQATIEVKTNAIDTLIQLSQAVETYYSQNIGLMESTRKRF